MKIQSHKTLWNFLAVFLTYKWMHTRFYGRVHQQENDTGIPPLMVTSSQTRKIEIIISTSSSYDFS